MRPQPRETKLAAKKNRILNELFRNGGCSRLDLARRLNINAAMVGTYVAEFLEAGLLLEGEPSPVGRGRSPVPLQLDPEHGCFLGLDFEALRARAVLCDFAGNALLEKETPFSPAITLETMFTGNYDDNMLPHSSVLMRTRIALKAGNYQERAVGLGAFPGEALVIRVIPDRRRRSLFPGLDLVIAHEELRIGRFQFRLGLPGCFDERNQLGAAGEFRSQLRDLRLLAIARQRVQLRLL